MNENNYNQNGFSEQNNFAQANENNFNQNVSPKKEEKESGIKWVIYIVVAIVIFIIILLLLKGCNALKNKTKNQIIETNEWAANMWNKCVDPVYWYTVDGTGIDGEEIDIESVLKACDKYYEESKNLEIDLEKIDDNDFKEAYNKVKNQTEVVLPKIKSTNLQKSVRVDFEDDMDLFYDYQLKLYELVKNKYSEG